MQSVIRDILEFAAPSRVRREKNGAIVLEGCKLLGNRSANVNPDGTHNVYPLEARKAAVPLYEGAKAAAAVLKAYGFKAYASERLD